MLGFTPCTQSRFFVPHGLSYKWAKGRKLIMHVYRFKSVNLEDPSQVSLARILQWLMLESSLLLTEHRGPGHLESHSDYSEEKSHCTTRIACHSFKLPSNEFKWIINRLCPSATEGFTLIYSHIHDWWKKKIAPGCAVACSDFRWSLIDSFKNCSVDFRWHMSWMNQAKKCLHAAPEQDLTRYVLETRGFKIRHRV